MPPRNRGRQCIQCFALVDDPDESMCAGCRQGEPAEPDDGYNYRFAFPEDMDEFYREDR
jgi:hypothetical protein